MINMKPFAYILLLTGGLLSTCCFSQKKSGNSFEIKGNIRGLKNDSLVVFVNNYDNNGARKPADTIIITAKNDVFNLKGTTSSARNAWANVGGFKSRKSFSFFLEKGTIEITGNIDSLNEVSVTGTPSNNDQKRSRAVTNSIYNRILLLRAKLKTIENGSEEFKLTSLAINENYDSIQAHELDFIKNNPNSLMSGTYLYVKQDKLPIDELEKLYNSLAVDVKASGFGHIVREKIKARKFVAVGNPAPDFISKDTSGNVVKLSDFRGKYVLLEFWANWCVPCRQQSPHLAKVYKEYSEKGFTILQYSIDEESAAAKWKEAIRKDQLTWTQVSDLSGFESRVAKLYGVQPIPDNFLISPDGKIVGRGLEGSDLEKMLSQLLK